MPPPREPLVITAPRAGARVTSPLEIRGTATPGARVAVEVRYEASGWSDARRGVLAREVVVADGRGNWSLTVRYSDVPSGATIVITAEVGGRDDSSAQRARVEVIQQ